MSKSALQIVEAVVVDMDHRIRADVFSSHQETYWINPWRALLHEAEAKLRAPAPLFTPEEIETVKNAAETIESEWPGHSKPAKLRRIAEKMSAPSEKPTKEV